MPEIGHQATVEVDGKEFTGTVYHIRENGWPCIETPTGRQASGPQVKMEIQLRSEWIEVSWYIFRTWSGLRKLNGLPYYGPTVLLGHGYKEPER